MTGWHISVYKLSDGGVAPAGADSVRAARIAVWQSDERGLDWLHALAKARDGIDLGGSGYPRCFTAQARHVVSALTDWPPNARTIWLHQSGDVLGEKWVGKTIIDRDAAAGCRPDEWLLIVAWDES